MPLNLEVRSGDFVPFCKFNAKAGRWYVKTEEGDEVEVTDLTAIFDLAHIKVGWVMFAEGQAPDRVWDNGQMAAQPTPQHRRGFSVNLYSPQKLGGLRELSSSSNTLIAAIKQLHSEWEAAPEHNKGLVPVVKCSGVVSQKTKFGTNYLPQLSITKWVPRPQGMGEPEEEAPLVPPPVTAAVQKTKAAAPPAEEAKDEF